MRAIIIVPRYANNYAPDMRLLPYTPTFIPLGLAYIASSLKKHGYETDVLNLNLHEESVDQLIQKGTSEVRYDLMLTGGLSTHFSPVRECVNITRKYSPNTTIVLGGGLVSSQPELIFKVMQPNYLVIGEGEETAVELMQSLQNGVDISKIDGIGYRNTMNALEITRPRRPVQNIDSIPWPDLEGIGLDAILERTYPSQTYMYDVMDWPRPYPIIGSRSCPYLCTFCFHPVGNRYRQRSIAGIMQELSFALKRYRVNIVGVYDELFATDRRRVLQFCEGIQRLANQVPWEVKWFCQMRVDSADEQLFGAMKEAGCYSLSLGLESYSLSVLKSMRKHITPRQIDGALKAARRVQIGVQGNFIFGDRAETVETARDTLNYWRDNHGMHGDAIGLGFIEPYPGTALYKHCLRAGLITDELDFIENHILDPVNMSDRMTEKEFELLKTDIMIANLMHERCVVPWKVMRVEGNYEVYVKCPYCREIVVYRNYAPPVRGRDRRSIACRKCSMRFYLVTRYYMFTHMVGRWIYAIFGHEGIVFVKCVVRSIEGIRERVLSARPSRRQ